MLVPVNSDVRLSMKFEGIPISASASVLIGIVQWTFSITCFAYLTVYEPWTMWLIDHGVTGQALIVTTYLLSFFIVVVLSLPGAYGICRLQPKKLIFYTTLAILPFVLWESRFLFSESRQLAPYMQWDTFIFGLVFGTTPFALAVFLMHRLTTRSSTLRPSASTGRGSATPLN